MSLELLDTSKDGRRFLLRDTETGSVSYSDTAQGTTPVRVAGVYLEQYHYVAAIKEANAAQGLIIGPHRKADPEDWVYLGEWMDFKNAVLRGGGKRK